jgi:hypothetical protein
MAASCDETRVSSKMRDDLQVVIAMLKKTDLDVALHSSTTGKARVVSAKRLGVSRVAMGASTLQRN